MLLITPHKVVKFKCGIIIKSGCSNMLKFKALYPQGSQLFLLKAVELCKRMGTSKFHNFFLMHCRSVKEFKEFVSGICAEGGDDDAEDGMGGLKAVTKLSWRDGVLTKVGMQNLDRLVLFMVVHFQLFTCMCRKLT